jgi:hypothetical protein
MAILNIPARTVANTPAEHVADHEKLRDVFNDAQSGSIRLFSAMDMVASEGSPSLASAVNGFVNAWLLDPAGTESVLMLLRPQHWNGTAEDGGNPTTYFDLWYNTPVVTTGNVVFGIQIAEIYDNIAPAWTTILTSAIPATATTVAKKVLVANLRPLDPTALYAIRVQRIGANGADTCTGDAAVIALDIRRA